MSSDYDATEFIDGDFQAQQLLHASAAAGPVSAQRAPSRAEVDSRVAEAQQKLSELKRAQEELERERAALEETRRRQMEYQTGRQEIVQNLTRGIGLLEQAEFKARRDSEQLAKALTDFRDALARIEAINEATWTPQSFATELTRALTTLENARMEWNAARLKFDVLGGPAPELATVETGRRLTCPPDLAACSFGQLCRLGLALTWPVAAVLLLAGIAIAALLFRH
jgi:predicted nuclease with TOPRIM domain